MAVSFSDLDETDAVLDELARQLDAVELSMAGIADLSALTALLSDGEEALERAEQHLVLVRDGLEGVAQRSTELASQLADGLEQLPQVQEAISALTTAIAQKIDEVLDKIVERFDDSISDATQLADAAEEACKSAEEVIEATKSDIMDALGKADGDARQVIDTATGVIDKSLGKVADTLEKILTIVRPIEPILAALEKLP